MNLKIKQNTGLTLDGNKLSGNTYPVKEWIKAYLGGKWDGNNKVWIVDTDKLNSLLARGANIYVDDSHAPVKSNNANGSARWNGWCNKCHSYCWGDCDAN